MQPGGPLEGQMPPLWEKSTGTLPDMQTRGPHWKRDCLQSWMGLGAPKPMLAERIEGPGPTLAPKGHLGGDLGNPWHGRWGSFFFVINRSTYSVMTDFPGPLFSPSGIVTGIDGTQSQMIHTTPQLLTREVYPGAPVPAHVWVPHPLAEKEDAHSIPDNCSIWRHPQRRHPPGEITVLGHEAHFSHPQRRSPLHPILFLK